MFPGGGGTFPGEEGLFRGRRDFSGGGGTFPGEGTFPGAGGGGGDFSKRNFS